MDITSQGILKKLAEAQPPENNKNTQDLKPKTGWFTWTYGRHASNHLRERLDRFVASTSWLHFFKDYFVSTELSSSFDHAMILNTHGADKEVSNQRQTDYFKFDECWAREERCAATVKEAWNGTIGNTMDKLQAVGTLLDSWQKSRRQSTKKEEVALRKTISKLETAPISDANVDALMKEKVVLKELLHKDEIYWLQRSRVE
ncbi:hypothetical protein F3Y22_tig00110429pilonHSYRG01332 [Hibiscus syriacus]|uniref:Uncharacterized protein n=1 Tax=Hibiscus syriacus TaxID=106335 RepID=A0A6A3AQF0_HIBSY|nr:hypothetical protein F3Y22_tig00110429pilonHSYRG01332 [Hibiscus syriacus]